MTAIAGLTGVSLRRAAISFSYRPLSRRLLSRCPSPASTPLLLGHFFHPRPPHPPDANEPRKPPPSVPVLQPLTASSPRLSLDFVPVEVSDFSLSDSHLGLLLLVTTNLLATEHIPRLLVCDPARRLHVTVPPPPCATHAAGGEFVGAALLSRAAHPSGLRFEAVCVTVDVDRPRAWVASFDDGQCRWRALPRPRGVIIDFDPFWLETHCVRAAGSLYWHICKADRVLALDAATLEFSFLPFPSWEESSYAKYRVGEMPEDGRLCIGSMEVQVLQLWVRGEDGKASDRGWVLEREMCMRQVFDAVPRLPRDPISRMYFSLGDIDAGRTGRVFIRAWVHGHYSYHLDTGKLECLATDDGMEYDHHILPYFSYPDGCGSD